MPATTSPSLRARPPRGQVSWITLFLLALLGGGAYLGWVWVPLYIVDFQVKQVVRDYMNQAVKNRADDELVEKMVHKLRVLHEDEVVDEDGGVARVPAVDLSPADIHWEADRTSEPPTLRVAFAYTRQIRYPYLDRTDEQVFEIDLTQDLTVPDWGPER